MTTPPHSTTNKATILTAETVPAYLSERATSIGLSPGPWTAVPITGGNVNYAFCATTTNTKVFVKQAPEYVAIFGPDGLPLTSQRMQKEYNVYQEWQRVLKDLAPKYLPRIYHFDDINMVFVMEFLDGYTLLDHELIQEQQTTTTSIASSLAEFMARTHAATHSTVVSNPDAYIQEYENRAMRDIQLEYVFTKCYKEATPEQCAGLQVNQEFLAEIEQLKALYNGDNVKNLCLTHGDLHPGSVMVGNNNNENHVKVIDPEFTVYGPAGLDVGSLMSGYVLAAVHQAHSNNPAAVMAIVTACRTIWETYEKIMLELKMPPATVKEIEIDSVGFTVAEVCRTALGFAGVRLWLQFDNDTVKKAAVQAALKIVDQCMIARHQSGMKVLLDAMQDLVVLVDN